MFFNKLFRRPKASTHNDGFIGAPTNEYDSLTRWMAMLTDEVRKRLQLLVHSTKKYVVFGKTFRGK
jgi:hypothetical protein